MTRLGGYLNKDEHAAFKRYAESIHFKDAQLAALLVVRELRLRRLGALKEKFALTAPSKSRGRITSSALSDHATMDFTEISEGLGLKKDNAMTILLRAELNERWLAKALEST